MREYRVVKVSEIKIGDREIRLDDTELADLTADIRQRGLQVPILVDSDLNLIDGLRRLQSLSPNFDVDVVVSDEYVETLEIMRLNKKGPFRRAWDMRRVWDFHLATTKQRKENHYFRVTEGNRRKRKNLLDIAGEKKPHSLSRQILGELSGMPAAEIQAGMYIFSRAYGLIKEPDPEILALTRELVAKIDAGYNIYSARYEVEQLKNRDKGSISTEADQRKVLQRAASSAKVLTGVFKDFATINNGITKEEAEEYLKTLWNARTDFQIIIRKLKERIDRS